jgi:hypothetical protein
MTKRIDSPIPRYPGYILLPDYYGFGELIAWGESVDKWPAIETIESMTDRLQSFRAQEASVLPMVAEWHIEGLPEHPDHLPATPIASAIKLLGWVIGEVGRIINEDEAISPLSEGASTDG